MAYRRRSGLDLERILTLGDTVPRSVGGILWAMLIATVGTMMSQSLWDLLCLDPAAVWQGQVWRLVTWVFSQGRGQSAAINLLFSGFVLHWLGRDLAHTWSERRFLQVFFGYTVWAAAWTTLLAAIWQGADRYTIGVWPVELGLLVGWAFSRPGAQVNFFGVLPLTGKVLGWLIVGGTVLVAVSSPPAAGEYVPHLAAIALAFLLNAGITPRRLWLKAKQAWVGARLKRSRSHLRAVPRDDKPKWMN